MRIVQWIYPALITLWQGTKSGIGFNLHAVPTALTALGDPIFFAIVKYEAVSPLGIEHRAFQTSN